MNLITHLQFGDNEEELYDKDYPVIEFRSRFSRGYNNSRPETPPDCTCMDVTLVAPDKNDLGLQEWYFTNSFRNGRIYSEVMDLSVQGEYQSVRSIYFRDARCYALSENYDINGDSLRLMRLSIRCRQTKVDGVPFHGVEESPE